MYLRYFALQDHPFAITPDPAFLYLSAHHREALGHLVYGTGEHGGFVQLTGEVGTGKTTLIRALLEQEQDVAQVDVALCLNPQLTVNDLLASICDELGVEYARTRALTLKYLIDKLNAHLLKTHAAGRRTVLIIDEAQNLSREVLEQVRLLTNLETGKHKLLRIILVGQPELEDILARPDLRQLAQRITARFHLPGLSRSETQEYIRHRLRVAGGDPGIFPAAVCAAVYRYSGGTPRLINTICERALMGAYAQEKKPVTQAMVRQAAKETLPRPAAATQTEPLAQQLLPVAVLLGAALVAFGLHFAIKAQWLAPATPVTVTEPAATLTDAPSKQALATPVVEAAEPPTKPPVYKLPEGDASMSQLLRLWGVFGAEVNVRCNALHIGDLRCLAESGSLRDLERFNRPALLSLRQGDREGRVLLSSLDGETATLIFADGTREWPRQELARLWNGEYQLVWRLQSSTRQIGEGSVGASVVWLRRRLARDEGVNLDAQAGPPSPVFDRALDAKLRSFQTRHALEADGLVGAKTMITLNNLAPAPGTPLLNPEHKKAENEPVKSEPPAEPLAAQPECPGVDALPSVQELARVQFSANKTDVPATARPEIARLGKELAARKAGVYVAGTAYNSRSKPEQLNRLARLRAQSTAALLLRYGVNVGAINCIVMSGSQAPDTRMDRSAIIYRAAAKRR